jgi:Skp family chaperone for outer membrane proteins
MKSLILYIHSIPILLLLLPYIHAQQSNNGSQLITNRIAVIDTEVFYDKEEGITRLVNMINNINQEFNPRDTEMKTLLSQYRSLNDELSKAVPGADAKLLQQKRDQAQALERTIKYKGEDAERDYNRRMRDLVLPLTKDLSKALDSFAERRGIILLLDASKLDGTILYLGDGIDITRDFIKEYNQQSSIVPISK